MKKKYIYIFINNINNYLYYFIDYIDIKLNPFFLLLLFLLLLINIYINLYC